MLYRQIRFTIAQKEKTGIVLGSNSLKHRMIRTISHFIAYTCALFAF